MEQKRYDAFISYRHHPADMAIAGEIQRLLEAYRPPRSVKNLKKNRIRRIFRDTTELPDSSDLGESLNQALISSEYLIVILSPEMLESKWCMQEIRTFKENHGNRCDHILPVLVRGEPEDTIPDLLRTETRTVTGADGVEREVEVEIEPLCCDVKADTLSQSKKKARTEFLRLAAPILGCGYDDLYRRNLRRARRRALAAALAAFALISAVLAVVSVFAYKTYVAEQNVRSNLVDVYVRNGADRIAEDEQALGMMYYSKALSLDPKAQAAKTGALLLLQQYGWLCRERVDAGRLINGQIHEGSPVAADGEGRELHISSRGYYLSDDPGAILSTGDLLASADDGSCFAFLEDDAAVLCFPASRARIAIPLPIAGISEDDYIPYRYRVPAAMAIRGDRAGIALGETLYVYDLDAAAETCSEFARFDLGEIFTPGQERSILSSFMNAWFDVGGGLAVVTNNSATAVFDIAGDPAMLNNVHQATGQVLQAAAFSEDGSHYALAYGNDEGVYGLSGGCLRVYDRSGKACMETEFEGGIALKGAAFEPGGPRVAAWGSGELLVWNWQDGSVVVPSTRIGSVSALSWTADGKLLIDDGQGSVSTYAIAQYAVADAAGAPEASEKPSFRGAEAAIRDGYVIRHEYTTVTVQNDRGETTDERSIPELELASEGLNQLSVNRMFVDRAHSTAYLWSDGGSALIALTVNDAGKIASLRRLDTQNKKPLALYAAWNGVMVETTSSELCYYEDGESVARAALKPATVGEVSAFVSSPQGLVSFAIRNKRFTVGYSNDLTYGLELWDLSKGVRIQEFIHDGRVAPEGLAFDGDGCLTYTLEDAQVRWLVDAADPDGALVEALNRVSCYEIGDNQAIQARPSEYATQAVANWSPGLVQDNRAADAPEETQEQRMARVLARDGAEKWLEAYDAWWRSDAAQAMDLENLTATFLDYVATGINAGLIERLRVGFEVALDRVSVAGLLSSADFIRIGYALNGALAETDRYTDLITAYYDDIAEQYEAASSDPYALPNAYILRVESRLLRGMGRDAFDMDDNPVYAPYMALLKPSLVSLDIQKALVCGEPVLAAQLLAASGDSPDDYYMLFEDCSVYMRLGYLSEADYSTFVQNIPSFTGISLTQVSAAQFADGLRLGDNVVAVDGEYFGYSRDLIRLSESHPVARLTVLRDGEAIVTEPMAWGQLYGSFDG